VITINVVADVASSVSGTLTNTAQIFGGNPDPNPGNNTDTATTIVQTRADLSIVKIASPSPAVLGQV